MVAQLQKQGLSEQAQAFKMIFTAIPIIKDRKIFNMLFNEKTIKTLKIGTNS